MPSLEHPSELLPDLAVAILKQYACQNNSLLFYFYTFLVIYSYFKVWVYAPVLCRFERSDNTNLLN